MAFRSAAVGVDGETLEQHLSEYLMVLAHAMVVRNPSQPYDVNDFDLRHKVTVHVDDATYVDGWIYSTNIVDRTFDEIILMMGHSSDAESLPRALVRVRREVYPYATGKTTSAWRCTSAVATPEDGTSEELKRYIDRLREVAN